MFLNKAFPKVKFMFKKLNWVRSDLAQRYTIKSLLLFLLIFSFVLFGCEKDSPLPKNTAEFEEELTESNSDTQNNENTVTLTIEGYETTILPATLVEIQEDDTILDVTTRELKEKGIPYSVKGTGPFSYVEGINNLFEFDHGPLSGWLIIKNGEHINHSAGVEPVSSGDEIEWYYTTEKTEID